VSAPQVRKALLAWYDRTARDLPWRRSRDPYAIWVSEIMLQQTRVETVIPYYERFLTRFPHVHALASAAEDDVLAHWSGLGYYRRARLLHRGAQHVVAVHEGQVPRDPTQRLAMPGVGRYTAGAIGSIAYDLPEPIVDGNVARVLARMLAIDTALGERVTETRLWGEAAQLAQGERPGALNQALMELGALVCTPQKPRCVECPVREHCRAFAERRVDVLPVVPAKKAPKALQLVAVHAVDREGKVWLARSEGSLFGGLWGVPMSEGKGAALATDLTKRVGLSGTLSKKAVGHVRHVLTHRALAIEVFSLHGATGKAHATLKCLRADALDALGISTLTRKILQVGAASSLRSV
jgi:A/G-specific adenine glycosylase